MPSSPLIHPVPVPVSFCCVCLSIHRARIFSYWLYHVRPCRTIVLLWVWLRLYQNTLLLMLQLYPIDIIIITVRIVYFRHSRSQSRVSIPVNIGQISLYASSSVLAPSHSCLPPSFNRGSITMFQEEVPPSTKCFSGNTRADLCFCLSQGCF